jgi:outer membrane protein, heavy metal efflux system
MRWLWNCCTWSIPMFGGSQKHVWLPLASLLVAHLAAAAEPVPEPPPLPNLLSLEDAMALFRRDGLDVLIAESAVEGAEGDVGVAGAVPNPSLSGTFGKSFVCADGCNFLPAPALGVGLGDQNAIEDSLSGKRGLRLEVARAALRAVKLGRADAERTGAALVRQQFVQALIAQESLLTAEETAHDSAQLRDLMNVRYRSGAVSEADLARVETDALEAQQSVATAHLQLRTAKLGLAFLLGVRSAVPEYRVVAPELLTAVVPQQLSGASSESLLTEALDARPDLQASKAQVARADASVRLAKRLVFPDIAVSASYAQQGTSALAVTPPTVTVGLTFILPVFYQQQGEVRRAEADVRTQELGRAKAQAQVVSEVETAFAAYHTALERAQRMEGDAGMLARARRARDLVGIQYQKGAASLLELLDAQRTFRAIAFEARSNLADYWSSVFRLEQAVGRTLQ